MVGLINEDNTVYNEKHIIPQIMTKFKKWIRRHKKLSITIAVILVVLLLLGIYIGIGASKFKSTLDKTKVDAAYLKEQQSSKSLEGIITGIKNLQPDIVELQSDLAYFVPFKYVPFVNGYYNNADSTLSALSSIDKAGVTIATGLKPIANSLGYGDQNVEGKDKTAAFVAGLPTISQALSDASGDLNNAKTYIDYIDPNYVPSLTVGGVNIKDQFSTYRDSFNNFVEFVPKFKDIAPVLMNALGSPTSKNYLMLFQNDKELRPTGGFITAYGYVDLNNGKLGNLNGIDIYNLDSKETNLPQAPQQLKDYNKADKWYLRDANMSPDFPTTALQVEKIYKTIPAAPHIDGVVALDTQFVASLLNAVGPVKVPGYTVRDPNTHRAIGDEFTADNAMFNMEFYSESRESPDFTKLNRKQFITLLMKQIEDKVFAAQKDELFNLLQIAWNEAQQKHAMMYADDDSIEALLKEYSFAGIFPTVSDTDFFSMVETNLGGAKADFYIQREVDSSIEKQGDKYLKTVTVKFTNPQEYDGWLNGPYLAWVRFYLPSGSKLVSLSGVDGILRKYDELGYSVVDNHITAPYKIGSKIGELDVKIQYYLPTGTNFDNGYKLYIYKQAGVNSMKVNASYNGKTESQEINNDFTFDLGK